MTADPIGAGPRLRVGRVLEITGTVLLALSVLAMFAALGALVWVPVSGRGSVGDVVGWVPVAGAAIGVSQAFVLVGRELVREAGARTALRMTVDGTGIAWSGAGQGSLPWSRVGHVVVTARPRGGRRLRVVTPTAGPLPASAVTAPGPVQYLRRLTNTTHTALDVCVDRLDRPPSTVVDLIRRASAGRFPDAYPTDQFRQDTEDLS